MVTIKRKPTSPGEILREEFLIPLKISQKKLASHLGCDFKVINAQKAVDIYKVSREIKQLPKSLLRHAG